MKPIKNLILLIGIAISSYSNSAYLGTNINSIDSTRTSEISIGLESFIIPELPGFSRVRLQSETAKKLMMQHLIPNEGEELLAIFESGNPDKFIRVVSIKEIEDKYIKKEEFSQLKGALSEAQRVAANVFNDPKFKDMLKSLGKQLDFEIKNLYFSSHRFVDQSDALGITSSYKISLNSDPFVRVEIAAIIMNLQGKIISLQVISISGSSDDIEWAKSVSKELAAQIKGLNNGNIKINKEISVNKDTAVYNSSDKSVNISGNWEGTWTSHNGKNGGGVSATFVQRSDKLSGVFTLNDSPCINSGTISGVVSGEDMIMLIKSGEHTVSFTANDINPSSLSGSYMTTAGRCKGSSGDVAIVLGGTTSSFDKKNSHISPVPKKTRVNKHPLVLSCIGKDVKFSISRTTNDYEHYWEYVTINGDTLIVPKFGKYRFEYIKKGKRFWLAESGIRKDGWAELDSATGKFTASIKGRQLQAKCKNKKKKINLN